MGKTGLGWVPHNRIRTTANTQATCKRIWMVPNISP